jgi:hypothetical protein
LGCRKVSSAKLSLHAAKDASMSRSWASRDTSMGADTMWRLCRPKKRKQTRQ